MKNYLIIFLLFSITTIVGQSLNCQKFKNGKFKILKNSTAEESVLYRKGNVQIETLEKKNISLEFIVNWVEDCVYTLTPTEETLNNNQGLPKNAMLTVEIIEIKDNSYIQKSTSNFASFEYISEVIKIE